MLKYPMAFKAQARSVFGTQEPWEIESDSIHSKCAIPPEFGGRGGAFSPEDLFAQALTNCFVATFKVYAHASRLQFESLDAKSELVVDLGETGKPIMKKMVLSVTISGASNVERIQSLAEKAFASGFILNSVKTLLQLKLQVT